MSYRLATVLLLIAMLAAPPALSAAAANTARDPVAPVAERPAAGDAAPSATAPRDSGLTKACTCKCGATYRKVNPEPGETCQSVENDECITNDGQKSHLTDCDMRYVDKGDKALEPSIAEIP